VVTIRIPVPRFSSAALSNLVGLASLIAVVFAIGALTNWRWGLLAAGVFGVTLTVLAQVGAAQPAATATVTKLDEARARAEVSRPA
jgi:hypothetical protein